MGVCLSVDKDERIARARSEDIDKELQDVWKEERNVVRLLLLGELPSTSYICLSVFILLTNTCSNGVKVIVNHAFIVME